MLTFFAKPNNHIGVKEMQNNINPLIHTIGILRTHLCSFGMQECVLMNSWQKLDGKWCFYFRRINMRGDTIPGIYLPMNISEAVNVQHVQM